MKTEEHKQALIEHAKLLMRPDGKGKTTAVARIALAALTQPASAALKLPDVKQSTDDRIDYPYDNGWNACIAEVKRLNAPHTAPIEPICATGDAEWVKCCDGKPDIDVTVWCYGQYDDGSDDTDNYAFPGYMDKKGRWFACNNGDYVDGGYGNDYRACVARWMPLPAAPEE